jgi:hypothetical protein
MLSISWIMSFGPVIYKILNIESALTNKVYRCIHEDIYVCRYFAWYIRWDRATDKN